MLDNMYVTTKQKKISKMQLCVQLLGLKKKPQPTHKTQTLKLLLLLLNLLTEWK